MVHISHSVHSDLYVVALDLPGHGFSSPRPAGIFYHLINYVTDLKYVIDGMWVISMYVVTSL